MNLFRIRNFISFIVLFSLLRVEENDVRKTLAISGMSDEEECGESDGLMWKGTMDGQECIAKQRPEDTPGLVSSGKIDVDGITFYLYCTPEEKTRENQDSMKEEPDEEEDEGFVENEQVETDQGENEQVENEQVETDQGENEQVENEQVENERVEEDSSGEDVQMKKDEL